LARRGLSPFLDPALKAAELTIRENAREFTLQACEEFLHLSSPASSTRLHMNADK